LAWHGVIARLAGRTRRETNRRFRSLTPTATIRTR
jgi:hypothetical protein